MDWLLIVKEIIPIYLALFLSWPVAIFSIAAIVFWKYSEEIRSFIKNMSFVKWGPFEASNTRQGPTDDVEEKVEDDLQKQGISLTKEEWEEIDKLVNQQGTQIQDYQNALKAVAERAENFEFSYLNLALVHNTKLALYWFTLQTNKSSTKENFVGAFPLPPQIKDHPTEKEAIFNALLTNGLLSQEGPVYKATEKAERFLKHINFTLSR